MCKVDLTAAPILSQGHWAFNFTSVVQENSSGWYLYLIYISPHRDNMMITIHDGQ